MRPERLRSDRHRDAGAGVRHLHAAAQAVGRTEADGAHDAVAQLLLHFERQVAVGERQRIVDTRQLIAREFDVDHRADALDYRSLVHNRVLRSEFEYRSSLAAIRPPPLPPTISDISLVIAACRLLL